MLKRILFSLLVLLIIIQFIRPEKNTGNLDKSHDITTKYHVPDNIKIIMDKGCNDCHSNTTRYPWYSNIQPIGWWVADHVEEGKDELNFSEFTKRRLAGQNHKFEEIIETVKENEMPLPSYTWLGMHPEAKLSDDEKIAISNWASAQMDSLKKWYPADSLVRRR